MKPKRKQYSPSERFSFAIYFSDSHSSFYIFSKSSIKSKKYPKKNTTVQVFHVTFWLTPSMGNITIVLLNLEFFKASLLYLYGKQTRVTKRWEFWNLEKKDMNYVSSHNQRNGNFREVWKSSEIRQYKKTLISIFV